MDLRIDRETGRAEITDVLFDEPGGVDVSGSIKRRKNVEEEKEEPPFRLVWDVLVALKAQSFAEECLAWFLRVVLKCFRVLSIFLVFFFSFFFFFGNGPGSCLRGRRRQA